MTDRSCQFVKEDGSQCRQASLVEEDHCFWHSPEHAQEAAEARRLGGLRRRREHTVQGAYDIAGLETVPQIRRVLEIAVLDALGLDQSVNRCRVLIAAAQVAAKLLEAGDLEERVRSLVRRPGPHELAGALAARRAVGGGAGDARQRGGPGVRDGVGGVP